MFHLTHQLSFLYSLKAGFIILLYVEWLDRWFGLVTGFIELLQPVTTSSYDHFTNSQLYSSLYHKIFLLRLHQAFDIQQLPTMEPTPPLCLCQGVLSHNNLRLTLACLRTIIFTSWYVGFGYTQKKTLLPLVLLLLHAYLLLQKHVYQAVPFRWLSLLVLWFRLS